MSLSQISFSTAHHIIKVKTHKEKRLLGSSRAILSISIEGDSASHSILRKPKRVRPRLRAVIAGCFKICS